MNSSYDAIIVGLGAMGSAACYHLAKSGVRVLGIDAFNPPHTLGSSHGETRITREAVGEGRQYTPLAIRANQLWEDLETESGQLLLNRCGCLIFGPSDVQTAQHGVDGFLNETIDIAKEYNIPHELMGSFELKQRFPQFIYSEKDIGYFEPGAGYLMPEACIETHLRQAQVFGAEILTNSAVQSIETPSSTSVEVHAKDSTYTAAKVILSAGAYVAQFLPEELRKYFIVYRQVLHWFVPEAENHIFSSEVFPTFIRVGETSEEMFYGFPALHGRNQGVKIALEQFETSCTPDNIERAVSDDETALAHLMIHPYLPIHAAPTRSLTCMYTVTPDCDFVIDAHPEHEQILIASPCSGHGFKHSSAIGELLKQLTLKETPVCDASAFSLTRFSD